jgi:hypothetical protein
VAYPSEVGEHWYRVWLLLLQFINWSCVWLLLHFAI